MKRCLAAVSSKVAYLFSPSRRQLARTTREHQEQERQAANVRMFKDIQEKQKRHWDAVSALRRSAKASERDLLERGDPLEITVAAVLLPGGSYELPEEGVIVEDTSGEKRFIPPLTTAAGKDRWVKEGDRVRLCPGADSVILATLVGDKDRF